MNILLTLILLTNLTILASLAYAFLKIRGVYNEFRDFITPSSESTPSKLAQVCEAFSEMLGRSLVASLKAFLMGSKSGEVRQANAEVGAGIDASPLGTIVGMLPKSVRSSLIKNPQLLDYALNFMNRQKQTLSIPGNNGQLNQKKFDL